MWSTKCILDWESRLYTLKVKSIPITGPSLPNQESMNTELKYANDSTVNMEKIDEIQSQTSTRANTTYLHEASNSNQTISPYNAKQGRGERKRWVPKYSLGT